MQIPTWIKPALYGAGAGAIGLAVIGFSWGGWMTAGSAAEVSKKDTAAAVALILTPYCVEKSKMDPKSAEVMTEIKNASSYMQSGIVEDAGWATPLGADQPDRALARACLQALNKDI